VPASTIPGAREAYASAQQDLRDGTEDSARRDFERAGELDPSMGAAWLRLAPLYAWSDAARTRDLLRKAVQRRSSLDAHDQAELHALEPLLQVPYDFAEIERRLARALEQFPEDVELEDLLGLIRFNHGEDLASALRAYERASELDPRDAYVLSDIGWIQAYLGRSDEAFATLARASATSPTAAEPIWYRTWLLQEAGRCVELEAEAKRLIAAHAESDRGYGVLANALASQGGPLIAVEAALQQVFARSPERDRRRSELGGLLRVDLLRGDFATARRRAIALDREVALEPSAEQHADAIRFMVQACQESGEAQVAADAADDYLRRAEAWLSESRGDDFAAERDVTSILLDALYRAGRIDRPELARRRAAFLERWAKSRASSPSMGRYMWFYAWAAPAQTPEEANEALAQVPRYSPLPVFRPLSLANGAEGRVRFLAGQLDAAIPMLERARATCRALEDPVEHTRIYAVLGEALEQKGDAVGACVAYGVVLQRWGHAKPRSVTAERVRGRVARLRCSSP
jgi:serine/threonine-protein kinase